MFSARLPARLESNAFSVAHADLRRQGVPLVDLTVTNPTRVGLSYPTELLAGLSASEGLSYDPAPFGMMAAREAVAAEMSRGGVHVDPDRVVLTASTSEAYSLLFKLLCDPGDQVLVPQPSYPLFELLTQLDAVQAAPYRLEEHGVWSIDRESVIAACGARTRAVLVVSPNNPTGSMLRGDDREWLVAFASERGLALISDEVFADFPIAPRPDAVSLLGESRVLTFTLGGLSKSAGLPQLKLGWMVVSGPGAVVADALERLEMICDTYLSVSTPVQVAARRLIAGGVAVRDAIRQRVQQNYRELERAAAAHPSVRVVPPEGGWSVVVQVPETVGEEELALQLLRDARVVVHPGYFFDFSTGRPHRDQSAASAKSVCRGGDEDPQAGGPFVMRHRGVCLPLSSMPSSGSWGIGEIPDLVPMARWLQSASCDQLMLLPVGTMSAGKASPYSACSAMAIDPIYISLSSMEDFDRAGGVEHPPLELRQSLLAATRSPSVRFADVRRVKMAALWAAFERFLSDEWNNRTIRAGAFAVFTSLERWWLDDYALFQACAAEWPDGSWQNWPAAVAHREPAALSEARRHFARRILFEQYVQWMADLQWQQARHSAKALGVSLFGDLPFVVDAHSADVWARQDEFLTEVSVGVPPDAFSDTGQDWGLPMYRWDVVHRSNFAWLRQRARRMASLYDGFRVDHLVGFYRTYGKTPGGDLFFLPHDEPTQAWQGEQVMRAFLEPGVDVVAEDLGTVPDFVRASIARLGVGGYKVLRWERAWGQHGQPFVLPSEYPPRSVATTGTHDTEPMSVWWDEATVEDRHALAEVLGRAGIAAWDPSSPWSDGLRDAILRLMASAASDHVFFPIQDVFGWRDRINVPATVGDHNWTWRLPWPIDTWDQMAETRERAAFLASLRT